MLWIEVENARKSGPHRQHMIQALILASQGEAEKLSGEVANGALLAYAVDARDERGFRLDHRKHIIEAIARQALVDVPLTMAALTVTGTAGVGEVVLKPMTVEAAEVTRQLASLAWGSHPANQDLDAYAFFQADDLEYRYGEGQFGWWWSVLKGKDEVASGDVKSAEEARLALVRQLGIREKRR